MTDAGETSVEYVALENGAHADNAQVSSTPNGNSVYAHDSERWSHAPNTPVVYASPITSPLANLVHNGKQWDEVRLITYDG